MNNNKFGPYSPIRKAGNLYFVSGQVGVDPITTMAKKDIKSQTAQVLKNLEIVLKTEGVAIDQVVKTTVFLTDMNDFTVMNSVFEKFFSSSRPARSTVAVKELPRVGGDNPILIEIEAIAMKKDQP